MIPRPDSALRDIATRLATSIAPEIPSAYGAADAGITTMLLLMLAEEAGSGIDKRMQDARALKTLFETAAAAPGAAGRTAFVASEPESLTHADVSAWLDQGLELLIELHAWAEEEDPALNAGIWSFLFEHTERHRFDL